jgi:cytochrome c-type biogenesis protein CcmE
VELEARVALETHIEAAVPRRSGPQVRWSLLAAGVAIAGAIIYLVIANTGASARYYMTVSELRACHACAAQIVRVAGNVQAGSVVRDGATQTLRFSVIDASAPAAGLPVVYGGVVPDVFKPGVQVVVEGKLQNGVFHADSLLAKCPSKFQSATPAPANPLAHP